MAFIKSTISVLLTAWLAAIPGYSQLPKTEALLKDLEGKHQFYGSVVVRRGNNPLFQGAYGFRDRTSESRNTLESEYYLQEASQLFCATLTLMAVERGLVSLDEPLGTYIPAFKGKPSPQIRHMLSHSSGLGSRIYFTGEPPRTKAARASMAAEDGLYFRPGARFDYTDINPDLLGMVLENVTHKPYRDLLSEWISVPLDLRRTGFWFSPTGTETLAVIPGMEELYRLMRLSVDGLPGMDVRSSAEDVARFTEALSTGRLISKDSFALMQTGLYDDLRWTKGRAKVGLGAFVVPSGAVFQLGRAGVSQFNGYHALTYFDPRYSLTITVLANQWKPIPDDHALGLIVPTVYADLGLQE